ncbi:hypothetical protein FUAX_36660 [Fulvitalea axinellae]|uniref:DUF4369 domain-containing protein n=1 Tax=Fulvitalea axinellae TaxID=1182444 RepID=A0AAU9CGC2_9BACT|nr:hypothetical protein FUAX_36660 [Fulvitalea axinellae]
MTRFTLTLLALTLSTLISFGQSAVLYGKVENWPTDTLHFTTLPFHSPYSAQSGFVLLDKAGGYILKFPEIKAPFVFSVTAEKKFINQSQRLFLFDNLTDQYYYGQCVKLYTYTVSTLYLEPGDSLRVDLRKQKRYGHTELDFYGNSKASQEYFQTLFDLDSEFGDLIQDEAFSNASKLISEATQKKLKQLEEKKENLSPFVYDYAKAEIRYSGKVELLKSLRTKSDRVLDYLFKKKMPASIRRTLEIPKNKLAYATLTSEQFNEYLELYLHYKLSVKRHKFVRHQALNTEKFDFALRTLPKSTLYHYLANRLLEADKSAEINALYHKLLKKYPAGELNNQLVEKFGSMAQSNH